MTALCQQSYMNYKLTKLCRLCQVLRVFKHFGGAFLCRFKEGDEIAHSMFKYAQDLHRMK